jgi:hypothetical protein
VTPFYTLSPIARQLPVQVRLVRRHHPSPVRVSEKGTSGSGDGPRLGPAAAAFCRCVPAGMDGR